MGLKAKFREVQFRTRLSNDCRQRPWEKVLNPDLSSRRLLLVDMKILLIDKAF